MFKKEFVVRKKIVFFVLSVIIITFVFLYTPQTNRANEPCLANPIAHGTIIILNGVPSVGKTSIQKELQEIMDEPYLSLGVDNMLIGTLPEKCMTGEFLKKDRPKNGIQGMHGYYDTNEQGKIFKLEFGPACRKLIRGMHRAFATMADEKNSLIVDYILYDQKWLPDLVDALYGYRVYFVGVKAPIDIVQKREKKRGTSPEGHARAYYDTVHKHGEYDLMVDTLQLSPKEAAEKIKEFIQQHPRPKAFKRLYKKLIQ